VELPGADGADLAAPVADGRFQMAWSWAPRDQMGWKILRAARAGTAVQFDHGGVGEETRDPRLRAALGQRPVRLADQGLAASVRPLLEKQGVLLDPLPIEGRDFQPSAKRREVALELWKARHSFETNRPLDAGRATKAVLAADPDNLAGLLERGVFLWSAGKPEGKDLLTRAIRRYPWDAEAVHWYGHGTESGDKAESEAFFRLVSAIRPGQADLLYDLACTRSLAGDVDQSASYLERAIRAGFRRWELITADPDLRKLRESPKFAEVMREFGR
jgi:hypothetical protein